MKKLSLVLAALVLFAGVSFANPVKQDKKTEKKTTKTTKKGGKKVKKEVKKEETK